MPVSSRRSIVAGLIYFCIAFACGFLLGILRVIVVAPRLGALTAVLIELPLMLATSWLAARWVCAIMQVPATLGDRLLMGALAFALLMLAEATLGLSLFGRNLQSQLEALATTPGFAGLAGQFVFALFPVLIARSKRRA
jgi:hypothetical protein